MKRPQSHRSRPFDYEGSLRRLDAHRARQRRRRAIQRTAHAGVEAALAAAALAAAIGLPIWIALEQGLR